MKTTPPAFRIVDIETAPHSPSVIQFTDPFPGFDPSAVRCGNLKDPAKIAEKIESERLAHAREEDDYWRRAHARAALNPWTGQIVVIGLMDENGDSILIDGTEAEILARFWALYDLPGDPSLQWLVWSGSGDARRCFDFDFIVTRSRILGVGVPAHIRRGRFYSDRITDLAPEFLLHRHDAFCSLTKAAELLRLYETTHESAAGSFWLTRKTAADEVRGENFHEFWRAGGESRAKAGGYLINDLRHVYAIARRLL